MNAAASSTQDDPLNFTQDMCDQFGASAVEEFYKEARLGWRQRIISAQARQARINEANAKIERAHVEGLGRLRMQVDLETYHFAAARHGSYDIWKDGAFLKEMEREYPEMRVKSSSRNTTIINPGMPTPRPHVRLVAA